MGDIDFLGRFIEVRRAIVREHVGPTKNGKIQRVDMSQQLSTTLRTLRTQRKAETWQKGWGEVPNWVFINERGQPLDDCNVRNRIFHRCLEKARLRHLRFHDLRHTFASLLIAQNESPKKIQVLLGHQSSKITMDTYGHLYPEENRKAVDALDDAPIRNVRATTN